MAGTNTTGKYKGQGRDWARGGKNLGWGTTGGKLDVLEFPHSAVRYICIKCRKAEQVKNKLCGTCR